MFNVEHLRKRQELRLAPALELWNEAKAQLEKCIALAEAREREYREVSEDVQRKLEALDLVLAMVNDPRGEAPAVQAPKRRLMLPESPTADIKPTATTETAIQIRVSEPRSRGLGALLRATSRPLFPAHQRPRSSTLSITP